MFDPRKHSQPIALIAFLVGGCLLLCTVAAIPSFAQTFESLLSFDGAHGASPLFAPLIQDANGNFYGTTSRGGLHNAGTVFKMTPKGKLTILYTFCRRTAACLDGASPWAGVIRDRNGDFYGTTSGGGDHGAGTVFKISPSGHLITIYNFCAQTSCTDGAYPEAGLVQGSNGNFYGTTNAGGVSADRYGTVFEITPAGRLTVLHRFCAQENCADGAFPYAGLVQARGGNLYGTTSQLGTNGYGTVFRIAPSGHLTTIHSFGECDNGSPNGLVQARDGSFYGTTVGSDCTEGTVFRITRAGNLTTLYSFCSRENCTDGAYPDAGLVQATNGKFYGTTNQGGDPVNDGTIFEITAQGQLTTLHTFDGKDGSGPTAGVIQARNEKFYGTTEGGGSNNKCPEGCGTIFSLERGLLSINNR